MQPSWASYKTNCKETEKCKNKRVYSKYTECLIKVDQGQSSKQAED